MERCEKKKKKKKKKKKGCSVLSSKQKRAFILTVVQQFRVHHSGVYALYPMKFHCFFFFFKFDRFAKWFCPNISPQKSILVT